MALRLLARPLSQQICPHITRALSTTRPLASKRNRDRDRTLREPPADGFSSATAQQQRREAQAPAEPAHPSEPSASASTSQSATSQPVEPAVDASSPTPTPTPTFPSNSLPSLDFAPDSLPPPSTTDGASGRTGARAARDRADQSASQRLAGRLLSCMFILGIGAGVWHLGRDWDPDELKRRRKTPLPTGTGFVAFWQRVKTRSMEISGLFREPAWDELLPPPLPPPHQKPYTLLLSIDDLLITSTWDRQHGWRTAKRPGVDYFLAYLSQFYEIVIFTSQPFYHAGPITEKLDPYQFYVMYKLFREATRFVDGQVVKDISFLNRDPAKVVALDVHPEHFSLQPENAVIVPPWTGEAGDKGLIALIPFLESIGIYKPADVRPIISAYSGKDVAVEYARQEAEHKRAFLDEWRAKNKGRSMPGVGLSSGSFTLSSLFSSDPRAALSSGPEPLTYLEQKRREAQMQYLDEQAYLKKNEPEIKRMIEEDIKERERLAKEQGSSLFAVMGAILNGPPGVPPPPQEKKGEKETEKK